VLVEFDWPHFRLFHSSNAVCRLVCCNGVIGLLTDLRQRENKQQFSDAGVGQKAAIPGVKKKPLTKDQGLAIKSLAVSYFHMGSPTLSSAQSGFTSEFGMGSGGSHSL